MKIKKTIIKLQINILIRVSPYKKASLAGLTDYTANDISMFYQFQYFEEGNQPTKRNPLKFNSIYQKQNQLLVFLGKISVIFCASSVYRKDNIKFIHRNVHSFFIFVFYVSFWCTFFWSFFCAIQEKDVYKAVRELNSIVQEYDAVLVDFQPIKFIPFYYNSRGSVSNFFNWVLYLSHTNTHRTQVFILRALRQDEICWVLWAREL